MERVKGFLKKVKKSQYFPFILLFCLYLIINSLKKIEFGDDVGLFASLILIFKKSLKTVVAIIVLGAGICSKILMVFSATVWASGTRTSFILMISMIILCCMLLENNDKKYIEKFMKLAIIFCFVGFFEHFLFVK